MKFIIVEIKAKDLYTIYDTENKGVCCCSMYTLKQLVKDYKCKIVGLETKGGKLYCVEHNIDETVRKRKAPCICEDETKRSAKTIVRGLYPKNTGYEAGKIYLVNGKEYYVGCNTENGVTLCNLQGKSIDKSEIKEIKKKSPEEIEKKSLINIYNYTEKVYNLYTEINNLEQTLKTKKEKYNNLKNGFSSVVNKNNSIKYEKEVTGKENFSQSFYHNTLDKAYVSWVIKRTNRPITYTYGLEYRKPTTCHKPISKELGLEYVNSNRWISVTATDKELNIQEVSENDMW